ncbi:MAG: phosphoribosyl-ATP diphosphatase [Azospirillum sp.]|nr:phosphoribosyl-ATP diphosphatase [Azospirillum sp.]
MAEDKFGPDILERLHKTVLSRRGADPTSSYTAKLFARGTAKIAQKVGEEAVEAVIEAIRGDKAKLAEESADLLYHLVVLWADAKLDPSEVYALLAKREGTSGIIEKKSRKSGNDSKSGNDKGGTDKDGGDKDK